MYKTVTANNKASQSYFPSPPSGQETRKQSCSYTSQPAGFSTTETQHRVLLQDGSFHFRNTHLHPQSPAPGRETVQEEDSDIKPDT